MNIAVDAGCLGITDDRLKAGVYYVALHLLRELSKIDKKNNYILYSFNPIEKNILEQLSSNWKNKILPSKGWFHLSLPLQFLQEKPAIFLALSQVMPWYHPGKTIGIVHGLDFISSFHNHENDTKKLQKRTEYLIKHADTLVTTSQFLKKDLETIYKTKNVLVAQPGIDPIFYQKTTPFSLDKPYFLFIGSFKPSKNIPLLLKAFAGFLKQIKKPYYLVCIGSNYWYDTEIMKTVKGLDIQDSVLLYPAMEQTVLPQYYKGAVAFVSPSLYEGFGLPFLEAMASGCPVIGSTAGAIPEIVRYSGLLFEPSDYRGIAEGMIKVAENEAIRTTLITKGKKRARDFTWDIFAKNILEIITRYED